MLRKVHVKVQLLLGVSVKGVLASQNQDATQRHILKKIVGNGHFVNQKLPQCKFLKAQQGKHLKRLADTTAYY